MAEDRRSLSWLGAKWENAFFDGQWRPGAQMLTVRAPATGELLGIVGAPRAEDVADIAARALAAQSDWARTPPNQRARIMRAAAAVLERLAPQATDLLAREAGGTMMKSAFEAQVSAEEFYVAAGLLIQADGMTIHSMDPSRTSIMRRMPLGVVGVITPWNVPLGLAMRSVAPALALGNSVILKPDPQTPISGGVLLAHVLEEAGLPPGVFCMLPGGADIGEALTIAPAVRMISFTGSTAAGRRVGELAGRNLKKVALELGGNSPMLVLDDADIEAAASAGAFGSFFHQGQVCMATSRHIVDRKIADRYIEALAAKAARLTIGDPTKPETAIGPIINARQLDRIHAIVTESIARGARLVVGGAQDGPFYKPTVLAGVTPDMPAFAEEIFGPVAPVTIAENDEHAIALANDTAYGLSAAVYSGSLDRGLRVAERLRAGMVHVNDQTINDNAQAPMGGVGQSGNGARFSSLTAWDEFTEWRWTTSSGAPARYPF